MSAISKLTMPALRATAAAAMTLARKWVTSPAAKTAAVAAASSAAGYLLTRGNAAETNTWDDVMRYVDRTGDGLRMINASVASLAALPAADRQKVYADARESLTPEVAANIIESVEMTASSIAHSGDGQPAASNLDTEVYHRVNSRVQMIRSAMSALRVYDVSQLMLLRDVFFMDHDDFAAACAIIDGE